VPPIGARGRFGVLDAATEAYGELSGSVRDGTGVLDVAFEGYCALMTVWIGVPSVLDVGSEAYGALSGSDRDGPSVLDVASVAFGAPWTM
jgi:hypothetical protein